jgi:YegS/Rv2252/BmrU family lipid kinase
VTEHAAGSREVILLVNPGSRTGDDLLENAADRLAAHGLALRRLHAIDGDLEEAVRAAVDEQPDLVVIASGDGALSQAVGAFAHRDVVLGVLPTGTTNNFARTLGIPLDLDGALRVLAEGVVTEVDLGTVGNRHFANVVSLGIAVDIAEHVSPPLKRITGRGAYALSGVRALFRHQAFDVTLETDEGPLRYSTHELVVANGRFHSGVLIHEDVGPDDHRLLVFHLGDRTRLALLRSLILFAVRRPRALREGNFVRVRSARLATTPPQTLEVDGETDRSTPTDLGIDRNALKVVVPREFVQD